MNSVEARRVIAVVDDALDSLRVLSHITEEVLTGADQLSGIVGQEVARAMLQQSQHVQHAGADLSAEELRFSTSDLLQALKHHPESEAKITAVYDDRSLTMLNMLASFDKLRTIMQKKLTTSVEEDASVSEHYNEVCKREARALKEKQTLEQQLRLDRRERLNTQLAAKNTHAKAQAELDESQAEIQRRNIDVEAQATANRSQDVQYYADQQALLQKQLAELTLRAQKFGAESLEASEGLRKKRLKLHQEVEVWIQKYDEEMGAAEMTYQEELAQTQQVAEELRQCTEEHDSMLHDRLEHEDRLRKAEDEWRAKQAAEVMSRRAARIIQKSWHAYKVKADAEKKKAATADKKKGKGSAKAKKK
ncbi:hypothetical protein WJX79_008514 [Trebouxia sp. C0005]